MVLKPEPVFAAMEAIPRSPRSRVLLMSPQGRPLQQADLQRWSSDHDQLVFLCGHYEASTSGFAAWPMRRCRWVISSSPVVSCRR